MRKVSKTRYAYLELNELKKFQTTGRHFLEYSYVPPSCSKALLLSSENVEILASVLGVMGGGGTFLTKLWCCVGGEYNKIIWFYLLS